MHNILLAHKFNLKKLELITQEWIKYLKGTRKKTNVRQVSHKRVVSNLVRNNNEGLSFSYPLLILLHT